MEQLDAPLILIADDQKVMRYQLREVMEQAGYRVQEAWDGGQCLELYSQNQPDIVLLDAIMPVMDGFTCCAQLQQLPGAQYSPVLMITALEDQESVDRAFEVGATDYITKPIHWAVLLQRVRRLIQQSRLYRQLEAANQTLEIRVQERTAALRQSNEQLQREIAQHKLARAALQLTTERLQAVIDAVPGLVSWISSDLQYLGVNRYLAQAFNHTPEAFVGKSVGFLDGETELQKSDFNTFVHEFFASEVITATRELIVEIEAVPQNYLVIAQAYQQGQAAVFVGIDITAQKRGEAALQESEQLFRSLSACSPVGIFLADTTGHCTYTNPCFQTIAGFTFEEALGEGWLEFVHPSDRPLVVNEWQAYTQEAREFSIEFRFQPPVGLGRWVAARTSPMFTDNGKLLGHVGTVEDITESKQAAEDIRKALEKEKELGELKSRFITMVSHELRTPLTTIQSSTELLADAGYKWSEERQKRHFQQIYTAIHRMTSLLGNVLAISKAEAGKLEYRPTLLDLSRFCLDLVEEVKQIADSSHNILFFQDGNCGSASMDQTLLRHILTNLLLNAIKYSPNSPTVWFKLTCQSQEAIFQIQDQGIGIPEEDLRQLFASFHRARNVGNIPGTGLGLAIVKNCVQLHGGKIAIASKVGKGTRFTITLPLQSLVEPLTREVLNPQ
ncbi:ATP-binding protein [Neosynechococcus sphagnicola]|uniref:ATP-binding protein n=1 Tax=Neosynechococcus sphagnicola TaxID=1501145 RepID=UPI00068F3365|nr:ATP-binding protein [Neosynechococcus sphagnicola]